MTSHCYEEIVMYEENVLSVLREPYLDAPACTAGLFPCLCNRFVTGYHHSQAAVPVNSRLAEKAQLGIGFGQSINNVFKGHVF